MIDPRENDGSALRYTVVVLVGLCLLAAPAGVMAHGTDPAILDVLQTDDNEEATVVLSSRGLFRTLEDGTWQFLCPSLWSGPDTPVYATVPGETWLAGNTLARVEHQPAASFANAVSSVDTELDSTQVRSMAGASRVAILSSEGPGAATVWLVSQGLPEAAAQLEASPTTLAWWPDETLVAAGATPQGFTLFFVDSEAGTRSSQVLNIVPVPIAPELRIDEGRRFLVFENTERRGRVVELASDGTVLAEVYEGPAGAPVHGPIVLSSGELLVANDGEILRLADGEEPEVVAADRRYTCLARRGASLFACAQAELWRLDDTGSPTEREFVLQEASAPPFDELPPEVGFSCQSEWLDLVADAGRPPAPPPDEVEAMDIADPEPSDVAEASDVAEVPREDQGSSGCSFVRPHETTAPGAFAWLSVAALLGYCLLKDR